MTQPALSPWADRVRSALEAQGRRPIIEYLQRQRWFRGKGRSVADVRVVDAFELSSGAVPYLLAILLVEYRGGVQERYATPLTIRPTVDDGDPTAIAEVTNSSTHQWICDATKEDEVWSALCAVIGGERSLLGQYGSLAGRGIAGHGPELTASVDQVRVLSAEQSNTSVLLGQRIILKLIRKVEFGINPDSEILEFLTTKTSYRDVPRLLGLMTYHDSQVEEAVAEGTTIVAQGFVSNQGDGWSYTLKWLTAWLEEVRNVHPNLPRNSTDVIRSRFEMFLEDMRHLGMLTAHLHLALASQQEPEAFRPELITTEDVERWQGKMVQFLSEVCRDLRGASDEQRTLAGLSHEMVDGLESACRNRFNQLNLLANGRSMKIRHHGDYHLGQILKTQGGFVVIDFEGEPARPLEERRAKVCSLKDVAGMLRSFNYAAEVALKQQQPAFAADRAAIRKWEDSVRAVFLDGYWSVAQPGEATFLLDTRDDEMRVLQVYELDKALYELQYELRNRPDWLGIPLHGVQRLIQSEVS